MRRLSSKSLKDFLLACVFTLMSGVVALAQAQTVPDKIAFSGVTYALAWQSQPTPNYRKYEYLPQNQQLPYYRHMLLLEELSGEMTANDVVRAQLDFLNRRQQEQTDLVANHRVQVNEQTGEFLLDFVLSGSDPEVGTIIEWNVYRYAPRRKADGQNSVLLYGYSTRAYGDEDGRDFLMALKDERIKMITAMMSARIPALP